MAFSLANLGAAGSQIIPAMQQYKAKEQQLQMADMQIAQQKRQLAAEGAALQGILSQGTPQPPAPPQPPLPGQPSQPMQQPPMMGPGGMQTGGGTQSMMQPRPPMGTSPMGGGAPGPTGGPGAPMGQPQPGSAGGAPQQPGGGLSIVQLAQAIKQKNPGLDDATLFDAVKQAAALLNPAEKQLLNFMVAQQRNDTTQRGQTFAHEDRGAARDERGREADQRDNTQRRGQDITSKDRGAALDERAREADQTSNDRLKAREASAERVAKVQDRIDARVDKRTANSAEGKKAIATYKTLAAQRMAIQDQINAEMQGAADAQKLKQLQAQKKAIDDKIVSHWAQAEKAGVGLPRPSSLFQEGASKPEGKPEAAAGGEKTYKAGDVIEQGGKKYRVVGGDSKDPDVEEVK